MDYEEIYQFVKDVPPKYKCMVCYKLMREPQVTECCGQHFCQSCIKKWMAKSFEKECPHCRLTKCNYIRYLPMKREINEFEIYCRNKANGCTTTVALDKIDEHLSQCDFENVVCNCGFGYIRKDIQNHQQYSCPNRLVNCQYCNEMGEHRFITSTAHRNECPDFPIDCPQNCGVLGIKRKDLSYHKSGCPLELVECQYSSTGCQQLVLRKDYNTHLQTNVANHLELTMAAFTQLSTRYSALQKDHEELKKACNQGLFTAAGNTQTKFRFVGPGRGRPTLNFGKNMSFGNLMRPASYRVRLTKEQQLSNEQGLNEEYF